MVFRYNTITKILDPNLGTTSLGRVSLDCIVEIVNESNSEIIGALPNSSKAKYPTPGLRASKYASLDNLVRDKPALVPKAPVKLAKANGIPSLLTTLTLYESKLKRRRY